MSGNIISCLVTFSLKIISQIYNYYLIILIHSLFNLGNLGNHILFFTKNLGKIQEPYQTFINLNVGSNHLTIIFKNSSKHSVEHLVGITPIFFTKLVQTSGKIVGAHLFLPLSPSLTLPNHPPSHLLAGVTKSWRILATRAPQLIPNPTLSPSLPLTPNGCLALT